MILRRVRAAWKAFKEFRSDGVEPKQKAPAANATPEELSFYSAEEEMREIKRRFIDPNRRWYSDHQYWPFLMFRLSGIVTIVFSVALPAVASIAEPTFAHKEWVLSGMSVMIAALTGLSTFYRWERTWRGRSLSKSAIDALCAKWELEIANARRKVHPIERYAHLYLATGDLIANCRNVMSSEAEEFFSAMQFPQSDRTSQKLPPR